MGGATSYKQPSNPKTIDTAETGSRTRTLASRRLGSHANEGWDEIRYGGVHRIDLSPTLVEKLMYRYYLVGLGKDCEIAL